MCSAERLNDLKGTKFSCLRMIWMIRLHASSPPPPLSSAKCLSFSVFLCVAGPTNQVTTGEGKGGGARGAESYDRKKTWASINRSILSCAQFHFPISSSTQNFAPMTPLSRVPRKSAQKCSINPQTLEYAKCHSLKCLRMPSFSVKSRKDLVHRLARTYL